MFVAAVRCHLKASLFESKSERENKQEETISDLEVQLFMTLIVADSNYKDGSAEEHMAQEPSVPSAASQHRAYDKQPLRCR